MRYPSVVTLETFRLPDWYIDGIDTVPNASDNARDDHLDALG